jgi:hypothetical protein
MKTYLVMLPCVFLLGCVSSNTQLADLQKTYGQLKDGFYGVPVTRKELFDSQMVFIERFKRDDNNTVVRLRCMLDNKPYYLLFLEFPAIPKEQYDRLMEEFEVHVKRDYNLGNSKDPNYMSPKAINREKELYKLIYSGEAVWLYEVQLDQVEWARMQNAQRTYVISDSQRQSDDLDRQKHRDQYNRRIQQQNQWQQYQYQQQQYNNNMYNWVQNPKGLPPGGPPPLPPLY